MIGAKAAKQSKTKPNYSGVQVQTSVLGTTRPVIYGWGKLAGNMLWTADFQTIAHKTEEAGGKGGGQAGASVTYTYKTAVIIGLGQGPQNGIGQIWKSKTTTTLAKEGMTYFAGTQPQAVWGYLTTKHPNQALNYATEAYVAASALDLGDSADISNYNFEIKGFLAGAVPNFPKDADPAQVVIDALTNSDYGCNYPASRVGALTDFSNYARASGLLISLVANEQDTASDIFNSMVQMCNAEFVDSGGVLTIVPYGDQAISGNGATYTPPSAPLFDLTDDDFIADEGEDPVQLTRTRPADGYNQVSLEFLDRSNAYNTDTVPVQDLAQITLYGKLPEDTQQAHFFCSKETATIAAQLRLQRMLVRNNYTFKTGFKYAVLDPMDIITITDANLGLNRAWVRVKEIDEDDDGILSFQVEEYLAGTGSPALFDVNPATRYVQDLNAEPALASAPVIFEPNLSLSVSGGIEVWAAVAGSDAIWGGCDVYASDDGQTYKLVGTIHGNSRYGVLSAPLASAASPDQINTLSVDLTASNGSLTGGTTADATQLNTLCYVDGEYIAYANAELTATNKYDLTYLVRGAMGTTIGAHGAGSSFIRLDNQMVQIPVDQSRIGQTIYLKFVGFNGTGGGFQDISQVPAYTYVIGGGALTSVLADPTDVTTNYISGILQIRWTGITDLRQPIDYEIRRGAEFNNSQVMGRTTDLYFPAAGDGTYWVSAHYQTDQGLDVYSGNPPDIVVVNAALVKNVIATVDEEATGWSGTVSGGAQVLNGTVILAGSNDILSDLNVLADPDILWGGGVAPMGTYTAPVSHTITLSQAASCPVTMTWDVRGQSIYDNILAAPDVLSQQDVLGSQFNPLVKATPQVSLSQDGATFGAWQNFSPGVYTFRAIRFQMVLQSFRSDVTAVMDQWVYMVDVPDRDEQGKITSSGAGMTTFQYPGTDGTTPTPFNGGANGNSVPVPQITITNAQQGDQVVLLNETLAGFDYGVMNAGSYVARDLNYFTQGY